MHQIWNILAKFLHNINDFVIMTYPCKNCKCAHWLHKQNVPRHASHVYYCCHIRIILDMIVWYFESPQAWCQNIHAAHVSIDNVQDNCDCFCNMGIFLFFCEWLWLKCAARYYFCFMIMMIMKMEIKGEYFVKGRCACFYYYGKDGGVLPISVPIWSWWIQVKFGAVCENGAGTESFSSILPNWSKDLLIGEKRKNNVMIFVNWTEIGNLWYK